MNIYINEKPIEYKLESEKHVSDIIESITKWLNTNGHILISTKLNNELLSEKDSTLSAQTEGKLSFNIAPYSVIMGESLVGLLNNLTVIEKAIKTDSKQFFKKEFNLDTLFSDIELFLNPPELPILKKLFDESKSNSENKEVDLNLLNALKVFKLLTIERTNEFNNPLDELGKVNIFLKSLQNDFEEIAVNLQTQKSGEALQKITSFSEAMGKFNRLIPLIADEDSQTIFIGDQEIKVFLNEFNPILNELVDGFTGDDKILIGDLMEYEIAPRVKLICKFIDSRLKKD